MPVTGARVTLATGPTEENQPFSVPDGSMCAASLGVARRWSIVQYEPTSMVISLCAELPPDDSSKLDSRASHELKLDLDAFAREALEAQATRLGVSAEELARFAVLYYLADGDSGRISRRPPPVPSPDQPHPLGELLDRLSSAARAAGGHRRRRHAAAGELGGERAAPTVVQSMDRPLALAGQLGDLHGREPRHVAQDQHLALGAR